MRLRLTIILLLLLPYAVPAQSSMPPINFERNFLGGCSWLEYRSSSFSDDRHFGSLNRRFSYYNSNLGLFWEGHGWQGWMSDSTGNVTARFPSNDAEDVIELADGRLISATRENSGHLEWGAFRIDVHQDSTFGGQSWSYIGNEFTMEPEDIALSVTDSGFLLVTIMRLPDVLYHVTDSAMIAKLSLPLSQNLVSFFSIAGTGRIHDMESAGGEETYAAADSGIFRFNTTGAMMDMLPWPTTTTHIWEVGDSSVYFLDSAGIYRTDTFLSLPTDTFLVDMAFGPWFKFCPVDSGFWLVSPDTVALIGYDFQFIRGFSIYHPTLHLLDGSTDGEHVVYCGQNIGRNIVLGSNIVGSFLMHSYDMHGRDTLVPVDLELISLVAQNAFEYEDTFAGETWTIFDCTAKVANVGQKVVNDFDIQLQLPSGFAQNSNLRTFPFTGMGFAPGDTLDLTFNGLGFGYVSWNSRFGIVGCVNHPDGLIDINAYNNCRIDSGISIASIERPNAVSLLKFYPNPARESFKISPNALLDPNLPCELRLFDLMGREVAKRDLINPSDEFDCTGLAPAVYFVICQQEGIQALGRIQIAGE